MFPNRFGEITFDEFVQWNFIPYGRRSSTLAFQSLLVHVIEIETIRLDKRHGRFTKATQNQIWFIKKVWVFLLYSSPILLPIDSLFFLLHTPTNNITFQTIKHSTTIFQQIQNT